MPAEDSGRGDPGSSPEAARLRVVLVRLSRQLRSRSAVELTGQLSALSRLEQCGPLRRSGLAEAEGTAAPSACRLVETLMLRRPVERTPGPVDGRASLIGLSRGGRVLLAQLETRGTETLRVGLDDLPGAEQAALRQALPALKARVGRLQRPPRVRDAVRRTPGSAPARARR